MKAKQFFKSTTFKCIITLLCVLLISGIFLTVMNGLLAVSPEERFARALGKIYGKQVGYTQDFDIKQYNDNGTVEEAYLIEDGNYLIKATGKGGYDNGTVTCWIVVERTNKVVSGIGKIVIDSNVGQSYIDRVSSKALNQFSEFYKDGIVYTPDLITGATVMGTKNAICNAVNAALDFVNVKSGNVETAAQKLFKNLANIYGDKEISVYGVDENGNEKLIEETDESITGFVSSPAAVGKATVSSLYKVKFTDGEKEVLHFVISSTGRGGYPDYSETGTVTMLTALTVEDGAIQGIYKTIITANVGQSYIGNINHLDKYPDAEYTPGMEFDKAGGFITSGASYSSAAINNAINGALRYVEANIESLCPKVEIEGGEENE